MKTKHCESFFKINKLHDKLDITIFQRNLLSELTIASIHDTAIQRVQTICLINLHYPK